MAITNFIPTVWSENLYRALDKEYVAVRHCNREFEGDIKAMGDSVKIVGVGNVTVSDYTKNTDMGTPETLSDSVRTLDIDQAKYFNFQIDDVDRAQSMPRLMQEAMHLAASALANTADKYVFGLYEEAGNVVSGDVNEDTVIATVIDAVEKLYENNVSKSDNVVIEVSPAVAALILKAKVNLVAETKDVLEAGCIGAICGCKIYVSNNVVKDGDAHKCLVRTTRSIAFAEQLSEIEAYRPEQRFADAVKGLHLYGAKVVYPEEMVLLDLTVA
ncbi:MAG: P22 coat protein - protein 5 domain protein [Clostridia bacterium]|nr:P22 coat protein - protein 5 domain protein [Clostridia bacterium]